MNVFPRDLPRWLGLAALLDWLLPRTLARSAIFMPKAPVVIGLYEAFGLVGQIVATLSALLALTALAWSAWHAWRSAGWFGSGLPAASLLLLSLAFVVVPPAGWLAVTYQSLLLGAIALAGLQILGSGLSRDQKTAGGLAALALALSALYQAIPALYAALRWPGPPPLAAWLFDAGELVVVVCPAALWQAYGRGAGRGMWLLAAVPALVFAALRLANPALTGILAIWSTGLTLYLPWPLYALSLWLAGVAVLASLRRGEWAGWALLMLMAGGYAPQLSTQAFLGLIALRLLAAPKARAGLPASEAPAVYRAPVEAAQPAGAR
ncbi:MAG: hypothetical protein IT318_13060 [Anaerolineales bacterium]|nr:hypothetical protein [Anaerolineales bacterium]